MKSCKVTLFSLKRVQMEFAADLWYMLLCDMHRLSQLLKDKNYILNFILALLLIKQKQNFQSFCQKCKCFGWGYRTQEIKLRCLVLKTEKFCFENTWIKYWSKINSNRNMILTVILLKILRGKNLFLTVICKSNIFLLSSTAFIEYTGLDKPSCISPVLFL